LISAGGASGPPLELEQNSAKLRAQLKKRKNQGNGKSKGSPVKVTEIQAECPHCHTLYAVAASYVGQTVECEICHRRFRVVPAPADTDVPNESGHSRNTPPAKERVSASATRPGNNVKAAVGEDAEGFSFPEIKLILLPITPGTFRQGTDQGPAAERPARIVDITHPFRIGRFLITQAQYQHFMHTNPSYFHGAENPVENVSWFDAIEFCRRLTEVARAAKRISDNEFFRLPTEAEWEYVCRTDPGSTKLPAGDADATEVPETPVYCWGSSRAQLQLYAWYAANSNGTTHPVGEKKPCRWGLHDMQGNVAEWCMDWYAALSPDRAADPAGPETGGRKVRKGGCFASTAERCRGADRAGVAPDCHCALLGFRVALVSHGTPPFATISASW
jgi:formylglycine-generating enzyme required for sulfatase activity